MSKSNDSRQYRTGKQQIDASRRRSLKVIGAGVVAPFASLALPGASVRAADDILKRDVPEIEPVNPGSGLHDIELHVFSSTAVTEDSLLLRNNLDEPLVLKEIRPAMVIFNDRYIDLRTVIGNTTLTLAPLHTVSFRVYSQPLYGKHWSQLQNRSFAGAVDTATPDISEYLWAEDSVTAISDDAILVSAAAFVAGDTALLYAKPQQAVARAVQLS